MKPYVITGQIAREAICRRVLLTLLAVAVLLFVWYDGVEHGWRMATSRPDASSAPIDRAATAVGPAPAF